MLINQLESLNVINAPLPGTLPENCSISFNNLLPLHVTVKLSQLVSSGCPKNGSGFPSPGFFLVTFAQSSPEIGLLGLYSGAVLKSPSVALSVMQALVIIQISPSFNSIIFSPSSSSICIAVTVIPSPGLKSKSVTVAFILKSTPNPSK